LIHLASCGFEGFWHSAKGSTISPGASEMASTLRRFIGASTIVRRLSFGETSDR
jgi:hypothetical protein